MFCHVYDLLIKMKRVIKFLNQYLFKYPDYVFLYALFSWQKDFILKIPLLSDKEVKEAVKNGKSLIRFGDGEINVLLGIRNHYHDFSPRLQKMLDEVVSNYNSRSNYILGVPRFVNVTNQELRHMGKLRVWLPLKIVFFLRFNRKMSYIDSHNFYYDGYFEKVIVPEILDRNIIIVTKKETIAQLHSNKKLPWKNIIYIEAPEDNALNHYDDIKKFIDNELKGQDQSRVVMLFAMGPLGKYLIYEYAKSGIQCLDIGKVVEVMFTDVSISYLI